MEMTNNQYDKRFTHLLKMCNSLIVSLLPPPSACAKFGENQLVIDLSTTSKRWKMSLFSCIGALRGMTFCLFFSESIKNIFRMKERRFFTENVSVSLIGQSATGGLPFDLK